MSELFDKLNRVEALVEGLTDLCPEYLLHSIRHVQRNCDIQCYSHDPEDDGAQDNCSQPGRYDGDRMALALAEIPDLITIIRGQAELLRGAVVVRT